VVGWCGCGCGLEGFSAKALAVLGTIFIMVGRNKANVMSSSGRYIDSIRFAVAGLMDRTGNWTP